MVDGYRHDVFISYPRGAQAASWLFEHFLPLFRGWLDESAPRPVSVFVDESIEVGAPWPEELAGALGRSRLLLALWTPKYFRSRWCEAELATMFAREGWRQPLPAGELSGLVYPLRWNDGEHFPPEFTERAKWVDMEPFAFGSAGAFRAHPKFVEFEGVVKTIAADIVRRLSVIDATVPWSPDFPVVRPLPRPEPAFPMPRLSP